MKKSASIRDVAEEAGVSPSTVSHILNNTTKFSFSDETKEKVFAAAERLQYVPSEAAKTLGFGRTTGKSRSKLIGIVIPQTEERRKESPIMFGNPFYGTFLSAVETEMRKAGYHILLSGTNPGQSYLEIVKRRTLDGVIIIGAYPSKDEEEYKQYEVPTVLVDCYGSDNGFFYNIRTNDRVGGYMATKYLIDKGHRNIGIVTGEIKENGVNSERYRGYLDAMKEAGINPQKKWLFESYVDYQYGVEVARKLSQDRRGITALFSTADITAMGLLGEFHELGISVPDDISVVGFDDIDYAKMCSPRLTTIRQNVTEKGKKAAQMLIRAASGQTVTHQTVLVPMELVERGTVREINDQA